MKNFSITDKTKLTRKADRGAYDKEIVYTILDEALFCTLAYVRDNQPFQIPTGFCRIDDKLYVHGSVGSFYLREIAQNKLPVCISITLMDGLVLARSAMHHSVNYRSVVLFGNGEKVEDHDELYKSLEIFTNKMQPGRWDDVRRPSVKEWKATMVVAFPIIEASAKVRNGPPKDDEEDYTSDVWAGVIPTKIERLTPIPDPLLKDGITLPPYLK